MRTQGLLASLVFIQHNKLVTSKGSMEPITMEQILHWRHSETTNKDVKQTEKQNRSSALYVVGQLADSIKGA